MKNETSSPSPPPWPPATISFKHHETFEICINITTHHSYTPSLPIPLSSFNTNSLWNQNIYKLSHDSPWHSSNSSNLTNSATPPPPLHFIQETLSLLLRNSLASLYSKEGFGLPPSSKPRHHRLHHSTLLLLFSILQASSAPHSPWKLSPRPKGELDDAATARKEKSNYCPFCLLVKGCSPIFFFLFSLISNHTYSFFSFLLFNFLVKKFCSRSFHPHRRRRLIATSAVAATLIITDHLLRHLHPFYISSLKVGLSQPLEHTQHAWHIDERKYDS